MGDLLAAAARNIAGWHQSCLDALGISSRIDGATWVSESSAPFIYLGAVTLEGAYRAAGHFAAVKRLAASRPGTFAFNDTWSVLDPTSLGFEPFDHATWLARRPASSGVARSRVRVERVSEPASLAEFESAHHLGFESPGLGDLGRGGVYAEGLLRDPRMHVYVARAPSGEVAGGAMGFVDAGVVGVYSVSTRPEFRRQGYGEALTRAAIAGAATLPAVLQPSDMARAMYERLGFREIGKVTNWIRRA